MLDGNALRRLGLFTVLLATACDDGGEAPEPRDTGRDAASQGGDGGPKRGSDGGTKRDAGSPSGPCEIPPDCERVSLPFMMPFEPCCTESIACGFDISGSPQYREALAEAFSLRDDEMCVARERFFLRHPGSEELRIETEEGEEILLTTECDSASILSISFIGCCLPNGRCGVSTYGIWDTFAVIDPNAAFSKLECVSSMDLNAQIADSKIRGFRYLPDTDDACDYAGLDERLPPVEEF